MADRENRRAPGSSRPGGGQSGPNNNRPWDRPTRGGSRPPGGRPPSGSRRETRGEEPSLAVRGELLYGRNGVAEALRGRRRLHALLIADGVREDERIALLRERATAAGVEIRTVPRPALDGATGGANHQGVGLDAGAYEYVDAEDVLERPGTILVLDHLQDPQNVGTLLRAGEAAGLAGVVLPQDRAAGITPAVVNASAGAVELLPVAQVSNLARFLERSKEAGRWAIGLEDDERSIELFTGDLPLPAVLVVGAEGPGIGPNLRKHCDVLARIPMAGQVASLNASTAGSIALFELVRRVMVAGTNGPVA